MSDGKQLSYQELYLTVKQLEDSISDRSLIFCLCTNTIGSMVGYMAIIGANHVGRIQLLLCFLLIEVS